MTIRSRTSAVYDTAASSFSVAMPAGVQTGDRLLVFFVNDNATNVATTSSTGWSTDPAWRVQEGSGTNLAGRLFTKVATASNSLTINTTESQEAAVIVIALQGDGGTPTVLTNTAPTGSVSVAVPTASPGSGNYDSVVFLGLDANPPTTQTVTLTGGAGGYSSVLAAEPTTGSSMVGAYEFDRSFTGVSSIDPGTANWPNAEQGVIFHVVVAQVSTGPVNKAGSDSGTGSPGSGGVSATGTGSDGGTGAETGSVSPSGSDAGTGAEAGYVSEGKVGGDSGTGAEAYDSTGIVTEDDTATGTESWASTADLSPPVDEASTAESGFIGIPGSDEALGVDAHDPPTDVTVTTGEGATGRDGGYVETLYGNLVVSLYAIDAETGAYAALPDYESLEFSRERNSRGAIRLNYPANGQGFELLRGAVTANRDLEFELWTSGTPVGALRGYLQEGRGDDVAEDAVWDFAGGFQELRTDEAVVYPQDPGELIVDPDTGESEYSNAAREFIVNADTPGAVLITLMQQAHARGVLDDITWDFTLTHDSNGTPWADLLSAKFSPGVTYTQILDKLVDLGLAEWAVEWTGTERVLKLWVGGGRGADRTLGPRPVILRKGRNLLDAPRSWSLRDAGTTVLAAGDEAIYAEAEDATALARRDRRIERFVSLQNAADDEAVLAFAQAELSTLVEGITSIDHGIGMLPGEPRPIIAFDIGDWVYSQSGIELERLRVVQWNVSIDNERQLSGTVTLNDTMADAVEKLRKRLDAIQSGEAVVGTSEPGANTVDRTPPAAPEGVVASSIAYQDPAAGPGQTLAQVSVGWLPVTTNADGADNPLVQAAVYILDKIEEEILNPEVPDPEQEDGGPNYDPIQTDWTWKNCPQIVQDFNDALLALWVEDGSPDQQTWLADYIAETTQTPTAADDVAGYDVRYAYLGLDQVGGLPSSDPFPEEDRVYYPATPPSGTSGNSFSFGGVEGGSRLRIEVRAFDRAGNFGAWTSIAHDTSNDTTPPPVPSAPVGLKTWFRTLDIPWDGLGAEGEPMPIDFSHARVWVGQGADLTPPPEPVVGPVAFDPLETGPQYVANLYASGTWNVPDIPLGPGWYAALQTVDHTGNASARGVVAGPVFAQQLVGQDLIDDIIDATKLGPDSVQTLHIVDGALTSAKIQDAAILRAKIADLAVNDAKIETLSVGKLTAGTMNASVVIGGSFSTSASSTANRIVFDSAGIRLYQGTTVVGNWQVVDGSMLVTGMYRSGLAGARIQINPTGTIEMWPTSGTNKSTIQNENGEMVWRGPVDGGQRSGRINANMLGVGLNFSKEKDLLEQIRSEILVLDRQTRFTAPFQSFIVSEMWTMPVSGDPRVQFSTVDSSGDAYPYAFLSYQPSQGSNDDRPALVGNTVGLIFMGGGGESARLEVRHATSGWGSWLNVHANSLVPESSGTVKTGVEDIRAVIDPSEVISSSRARKFVHLHAPTDEPRVGLIAEELPEILVNRDTGVPGIDLVQVVATLWGFCNQLIDQESRSITGRALLPNRTYRAGDTIDIAVPWDEPPLEVPSSVTAIAMASMPTAMGKIKARIVPGTATLTGCTIRLTFEGIGSAVVVTNVLPIAVEAIGRYIYTPPYVPPEAP